MSSRCLSPGLLQPEANITRKRQEVLTGHASQEDRDRYARGANLLKLYEDVADLDPLADVKLDVKPR